MAKNNQLAFDIAEREFGISPAMTGIDMANMVAPDKLTMTFYVSRFYELFKDELPPVLRTQGEIEMRFFLKILKFQFLDQEGDKYALLCCLLGACSIEGFIRGQFYCQS